MSESTPEGAETPAKSPAPAAGLEPAAAPPAKPKAPGQTPKSVVIRSRPKVIFLWPLLLAALLAGVWTQVALSSNVPLHEVSLTPGRIFCWVFVFNLLALSFDFSRGEFLAVLLFFMVTILSIFLLDQNYDIGIIQGIEGGLSTVQLRAHPHLYFFLAAVLLLSLLGVWIQGFFDYWEISHNEILHHKGVLGDLKRYPAPNLQLHKEIPDLFEHCLFLPFGGAGRIVITPQGSERSVVLDNVIGVNRIESAIQKMLSSLQVKVDVSGNA